MNGVRWKSGDTVSFLAKQYDSSIDTNIYIIKVGQKLRVKEYVNGEKK
ncbi:MAG: LysM peptidoglycan-binding domain-containing protein [Rummeliibacillus sp.]